MKKRGLIYFVKITMFILILAIITYSQTNFFYSRGKKIPISEDSNAIVIKFKEGTTPTALNTILNNEDALQDLKSFSFQQARLFYKASLKSQTNVNQIINRLKDISEVEKIDHVYILGGVEAIPFDHFLVKFKPSVDRVQIEALNEQHNVEIVETRVSIPNLYRLRLTSNSDLSVVDMAKLYYESLPAEWSKPDFIVPVELNGIPNDTYFSNQYYLHNTGQTGGVTDADIDAPEAWDITKGSSSIAIAVIDCGVCPHEDLPSDRILPGYDYCYVPDNDPSPGGNNAHGMAVAGIIAASGNNSLGISGIAPECKIIPVRIFDDRGNGVGSGYDAEAIDFAWQNGADIISNSWTFKLVEDPDYYPEVRDAIERAFDYGRDPDGAGPLTPRGCVVVFATGNNAGRDYSYGFVEFPANVPGVIGVGAIDKSNNIQYYSPRDDEVDIVAPSGLIILRTGFMPGDVWSLDIPNQPGYNPGDFGIDPPDEFKHYTWDPPGGDAYPPGNYTAHFSGTSAACPQVSGVIALILSINPDLTHNQISSAGFLEHIVDDLGAYGWDNDFGWGRVNAYKAVKYTLENYGGTIGGVGETVVFNETITINNGATLTILPGTIVKFNNAYSTMIVVNSGGKVIAEGTSAYPITFEHASGINYWTAFSINSSGNIFKYCNFKHAGTDLIFSGVSGTNTIQNCNFQNYNSAAMYFSNSDYNGSTINLSSCTFQNNGNELKYSGNVRLTNSVNIPSNVTLTVYSGTSVKFNGYYYLVVQSGAKIIANGTQANPIVFTSATGSSPGSWRYIILYGGNNVFRYCKFRYGYIPLYLNYCSASEGSRNLIENCNIYHNSSYGIYVYRSLANIKGCTVYYNYHGIYCYFSSDIKFTGNIIYYNSHDGVRSYSNNILKFYGNVIRNNSNYGINTASADDIYLGEPYNSNFLGYNTIRNNGYTEVHAGSSNPHVVANYSSIHEENPQAPWYEIYNDPGNQNIFTQDCFWGNNCTPQYNSDGSFTFQNPQCTPTWDGQVFTDGPLGKVSVNSAGDFVTDSDNDFIIDMSLSDEEKIKSCKEIIANQSNSKDAREALILLYSIIRADYSENTLGEKNDFYSYLNNLYAKHANKGIGKTALRYMIYWKALENDDEVVMNLSNKALELFTGEEHNDILANLAITHTHRGELKESKSILNELKARCSAEDELVRIVEENIADVEWQIAEGIWEQDNTGKPSPPPEDQPVISTPDEFAFSTNYPNPFNPITTITFSLPEASHVRTEVYDLTGRCVAVLCDHHYPAGTYSVHFDGSALASGIYILRSRMTSVENPEKSQVFTRKMMLMK